MSEDIKKKKVDKNDDESTKKIVNESSKIFNRLETKTNGASSHSCQARDFKPNSGGNNRMNFTGNQKSHNSNESNRRQTNRERDFNSNSGGNNRRNFTENQKSHNSNESNWRQTNRERDFNSNSGGNNRRNFTENQKSHNSNESNWRQTNRERDFNSNSGGNNRRNFNANQSNPFPKTPSTHIQKFWDQLAKRVLHTTKSKFELKDDEQSLWFDTWKAAEAGASGPIKALPIAYLKLPSTANLSPSPLTIISVFIRICEEIKAIRPLRYEDFPTVNTLEQMLDIINSRLEYLIQQERAAQLIEKINRLNQIFVEAVTSSLNFFVKDTDRLARLLMRRNEIELFIKQVEVNSMAVEHGNVTHELKSVPWLGWQQNPTLSWLMSGSWHQNCSLKAIYETNEEYAETLLRVWTLLTFYWGSGAVWPKCGFKQRQDEASACGEPLLAHSAKGSQKVCKKNGCGRVAEWKCARFNHEGICQGCLLKVQDTLIGPPGQWASTDIYDAVIEREHSRREESVYLLHNVQCRKPFRIIPNWKTTYRLPCSVLVAIVKLSVSGEALSRSSPIQWAEIVPYNTKDGVNFDWKYRSEGKMAIRLLSKADCTGMPDEVDAHIDINTRVAVIDLRVFVPEVISVLGIFSRDDFKSQIDHIPFFNRLIGQESPQNPLKVFQPDQKTIRNCLNEALMSSEIDFIQRLSPMAKAQLIEEIYSLKPIQTLSGTQLDAFTAALFSAVHCTQGPPGTGKSYIGVCLVLALDLIRKKAEIAGHAVGPVLVLSYKNHALDEFLLDIITHYPSARQYHNRGTLIRTGKPEIESLQDFTERHSPYETKAQYHLANILDVQKKARNFVKSLYDCARNFDCKALLELEELEWTPLWTKSLQLMNNNICYSSIELIRALDLLYTVASISTDFTSTDPTIRCQAFDHSNQLETKDSFNTLQSFIYSISNGETDSFPTLPSLANLIIGIKENVEHWKTQRNSRPKKRLYNLIHEWLRGKKPPPRCQAFIADSLCLEEADETRKSPYCRLLHSCAIDLCVNVRKDKKKFCINHLCAKENCDQERFGQTQFCVKHACVKCLSNESAVTKCGLPIACAQHKCQVNNCNDLQVLFSMSKFCQRHACVMCVVSDRSANVNMRCDGSFVCKVHKCNVNGCSFKRYNLELEQCHIHMCRLCFSNGGQKRSVDMLCPNSQLCSEHRCSFSKLCINNKAPNSSNCQTHSCKECIRLGSAKIGVAVSKAPRNTCHLHKLCSFVSKKGKECDNIVQNNSLYCTNHSQVETKRTPAVRNCIGITSKGKPCKSKELRMNGGGIWHCVAHESQVKHVESSEEDDYSDDEEQNEQEQPLNVNSKPVLPPIEVFSVFKKYICNGKSDSHNCNVYAILKDHSEETWFCPVHQKRQKDINEVKIEPKKNTAPIVNDEKVVKLDLKDLNVKEIAQKDTGISLNSSVNSVLIEEPDIEDKLRNVDADEIDEYYETNEEMNEELRRLQEQTEIGNNSEDEDNEYEVEVNEKEIDTASSEPLNKESTEQDLDILSSLENWSWESSRADRLISAAQCLRYAAYIANKLIKSSEGYLSQARKQKSEAGAQAFRNARIVGATVVGASRRLEAIRAAGPFAVVVEEACEVIEPTLMSVLACNTLRKLELIGDHRQLPAFVQSCWFSFETTMPSIKTSLFERLVSGTTTSYSNSNKKQAENKAATLPYTILDEQRRMRSTIADITRPDYIDVVNICDHDSTGTQCIGDKVIQSCPDKSQVTNLKKQRACWPSQGRCVPGLAQNIFFWDLSNNAESRPIAGLSACNLAEASAVASLTKWLFLSGCPPASISIITPYKGQKLAITQELRKQNLLTPFRKDSPPPRGTTLTISTIDRYQGDENDIVILSLVRCNPGNRFVALKNRFVVAVSRARLGFFVIGSVKALTTARDGSSHVPAHWNRFIKSLKDSEDSTNPFIETRCANELPICCPRHSQESKHFVKDPLKDFPSDSSWSKFCSVPCQFILERCGHVCNLPCHSPVLTDHNKKCQKEFIRPCDIHINTVLYCHDLNIEQNESVDKAIERFKCQLEVSYTRPECGHTVKLQCYEKKSLLEKKSTIEECQVGVSDYIHPVCGHRFKNQKCFKKRQFEIKPPTCAESVSHRRPCGCETIMPCYESIRESVEPSECNSSVQFMRPRCGHSLSLRCSKATKLKKHWDVKGFDSAIDHTDPSKETIVIHGKQYGPSENSLLPEIPVCSQKVYYKGPCGHHTIQTCSHSFEFASSMKPSPECTELTSFTCFVCCNGRVNLPCWLTLKFASINIWPSESIPVKRSNGIIALSEANLKAAELEIAPLLNDHRAIKYLQRNTFCNNQLIVFRLCNNTHYTALTCTQLFETLLKKDPLKICKTQVDRELKCKHTIKVQCYAKNQHPPPTCSLPVDKIFTYQCGQHSIKPGTCSKYTTLLEADNPKCTELIPCSRRRCGHKIVAPCHLKSAIQGPSPAHEKLDTVTGTEQKIIKSNIDYYETEEGMSKCTELVSYWYNHCGHLRSGVQCSSAFTWAANNDLELSCEELVCLKSPVCGHDLKIKCYLVDLVKDWNPWVNIKKPTVTRYVRRLDENKEPIFAYSLNEKDLNFKLTLPNECQLSECAAKFNIVRICGHEFESSCSNVYWKSYSPCVEPVTNKCPKIDCGHETKVQCHKYTANKLANKTFYCMNRLEKLCQKCQVNKVEVQCCKALFECHSEVSLVLEGCGHEIVWKCGDDEDPRLNSNRCKFCVYVKWEKLIANSDKVNENPRLMGKILVDIKKVLLGYDKQAKFVDINFLPDLSNHVQCRPIIINRYLENARYNGDLINSPQIHSLVDEKLYEKVFVQVKSVEDKLEQIPTLYGKGYEMTVLSESALSLCKPDSDGLVNILVGVAFRFNVSAYGEPFCAAINKKGKTRANKTSNEHKEAGFDYKSITPPESTLKKFLYWEPGSCIALSTVTLQTCSMCIICFDYQPTGKGFPCPSKHFQCWDCFNEFVKQASGPDSVGKTINEKGNMICPDTKCNKEITLHNVAKENVPEKLFESLTKLKTEFEIKRAVDKALKEHEARRLKEQARLDAIRDEEERYAERVRLDLIENVLTLRCQRCKTAFIDYVGCAALTCGYCKAGFCALCLKDCGSDAHSHVTHCPENISGKIFIRDEDFKEHHRKRREKIINEKIKEMPKKAQDFLMPKIKKELNDLGIKVDVKKAQAQANQASIMRDQEQSKIDRFLGRFF